MLSFGQWFDIPMIEEIHEEHCIGGIKDHTQVEQVRAIHTTAPRPSCMPSEEIHKYPQKHLRQLHRGDNLQWTQN